MESWIHRYINPIEPGLLGSSMKIDFMIFHEVLKISSEDENNYTSVHNTFVFIHPGPVVASFTSVSSRSSPKNNQFLFSSKGPPVPSLIARTVPNPYTMGLP